MKRLISIILSLILLPAFALACQNAPTKVVSNNGNLVFSDPSWWPITEDCRIAGIKDVDEMLYHAGVQSTTSQFVAGKLVNGWARVPWSIRTVDIGRKTIGLTLLKNVTIVIWNEYECVSIDIVKTFLGEDAELSASTIVACATYWQGDDASLIFHPSYSDRFQVGYVSFNNGEAVTPLMVGHFGGELRFGLRTSDELPPEVIQAKAEAEASAIAKAQAEATANATVVIGNSGTVNQAGDGCYRNNTILQFNLSVFGAIQNWLGIGTKMGSGCEE